MVHFDVAKKQKIDYIKYKRTDRLVSPFFCAKILVAVVDICRVEFGFAATLLCAEKMVLQLMQQLSLWRKGILPKLLQKISDFLYLCFLLRSACVCK